MIGICGRFSRIAFHLRLCEDCPRCNLDYGAMTPCTSCSSGSNATLVGGVFGRMDAAYVTIEAQKSTKSLHAHGQCFVQCLHQHTPLQEIFSLAEDRLQILRAAYLEYVSHVSHSVYKGQGAEEMARGIADAEAAWPEYQMDTAMTAFPEYLGARSRHGGTAEEEEEEAMDWARRYLCEDVVQLQYMKQHHYHKLNADTGERTPLRGCQRADKPGECKSDYPRTAWVSDESVVLCPCELQKKGLDQHGRKNRLCSLHGPYGHEYLNGCHPALLAGIRGGNVDVQVPYRLPYACRTCGQKLTAAQRRAVAGAVQRAQDAQTGYCSDYCAKNQPMAFHEIREFQKGHCKLHAEILQRGDSLDKVGKKHAMRIMSDAYLKGIVRGQVECCNLRANHSEESAVAAERVTSAVLQSFPGGAFLNAVRRLADKDDAVSQATAWRKQRRQLRAFDWAQAYGHRPCHAGLWELSPYEFFMYWDVLPAKVPKSRKEWAEKRAEEWDVTMTAAGLAKLEKTKDNEANVKLRPGKDYKLKSRHRHGRHQYAAPSGAVLQHSWYLERRAIPHVPCFSHCPVPAPHEPAIARKYRLRTGMWRMQGRTHVEGVSIAGTAWGSTRRRGGRNSANKRREVSHQQTARARMGKAAPRKNSIRHLPRSYFISGIAGKASLNERKIGVAAKAWPRMWWLVRGTSSLHGPPSPRHRPHRQSERDFAWVSRCGGRVVARTCERKLGPRRCKYYLEYIAGSNLCPFWYGGHVGHRWPAGNKCLPSLAAAETVASR